MTTIEEKIIESIRIKFEKILNESIHYVDKDLDGYITISKKETVDQLEDDYYGQYFPKKYVKNGFIKVSTSKPYSSVIYSDLGEYVISINTNNFGVDIKGLNEYIESIVYYILEQCEVYLKIDLDNLLAWLGEEKYSKQCIIDILKGDYSKYLEYCNSDYDNNKHYEAINKIRIKYFNEIISGGKKNNNIIQHLNIISATSYESSICKGKLAIFEAEKVLKYYINNNQNSVIEFVEKVAIKDYKSARKTMEMSGEDWAVISDCNYIYGISKINNNLLKTASIVTFIDYYEYTITRKCIDFLSQNKDKLVDRCIHLKYGNPVNEDISLNKNDNEDIIYKIMNEFEEINELDKKNLESIIDMVIKQEKGTMLVITNQAEFESKRLSYQSTLINPKKLTQEIVNKISCIDGSILIDEKGKCYAIGVILDGPACENGDKGRGARYNSAIKYIHDRVNNKERIYKCVAVVKSEDGMIDVVTRHMFQSESKEGIEKKDISNENNKINLKKTKLKSDIFFEYIAESIYLDYIKPIDYYNPGLVYLRLGLYCKAINYYDYAIEKGKDDPISLYTDRGCAYYFLAVKEYYSQNKTRLDNYISKSIENFDIALNMHKENKRFISRRDEETIRIYKHRLNELENIEEGGDIESQGELMLLRELQDIDNKILEDLNNTDLLCDRIDICYSLITSKSNLDIDDEKVKIILKDIEHLHNINPKILETYVFINDIYGELLQDIKPDGLDYRNTSSVEINKYINILDKQLNYINKGIKEINDPNLYRFRSFIYKRLSETTNNKTKLKNLYRSLKDAEYCIKLSIKTNTYKEFDELYRFIIYVCDCLLTLEINKSKIDELTKKKNVYVKKVNSKS